MMLPMRGNFHRTDAADLLSIEKRFQNDFKDEARAGVKAEAIVIWGWERLEREKMGMRMELYRARAALEFRQEAQL
jgi:hypothetical protein